MPLRKLLERARQAGREASGWEGKRSGRLLVTLRRFGQSHANRQREEEKLNESHKISKGQRRLF